MISPNCRSASMSSDPPPSYEVILLDHKSPPQPLSPSPAVSSSVETLKLVKKPKLNLRRTVRNTWYYNLYSPPIESRVPNETKSTVESLLREIVETLGPDLRSNLAILSSCEGACEAHGLSFSDIIQEPSIEGHSPVYWAIVKRLPDGREVEDEGPDLISAFIFYATPLKDATIIEIRQACLAISDHKLFSRLKSYPGVGITYPMDRVLLGVKVPLDEIKVEESTTTDNAFVVNIVIPQFQRRMGISGAVLLEFIAQGRLWGIKFSVSTGAKFMQSDAPPPAVGTICLHLSIRECSSPTHIDSRLIIFKAMPTQSTPDLLGTNIPVSAEPSNLSQGRITADLKTHRDRPLRSINIESAGVAIVHPLKDDGVKLQTPNKSFVDSEGKLRARFEARVWN